MAAYALTRTSLADEPAVTRLLALSYGKLLPTAYGEALTSELLPIIAKARPELLSSGTYCQAITPKGQVVGAGGWTRERPGSGDIEAGTGHIRHVAVHPDWVGKGVGRALVDHATAEAMAVGIRRFECYASLNAVDFYACLGFLSVRPIDIPMGGDLVMPSMVMERRF